jgi:hypothetical protein
MKDKTCWQATNQKLQSMECGEKCFLSQKEILKNHETINND